MPDELPPDDLDALIERVRGGDQAELARFVAQVQPELRDQAARMLRGERVEHTLQPTSLVNEAWLRLLGSLGEPTWENRRTFFTGAATAMRRVLVDHARRRGREKRGGDRARVPLEPLLDGLAGEPLAAPELIDLHEALAEFAEVHARAARVVEMRIFGGLTISETAAVLDVATSTVELDFRAARVWLQDRLGDAREADPT